MENQELNKKIESYFEKLDTVILRNEEFKTELKSRMDSQEELSTNLINEIFELKTKVCELEENIKNLNETCENLKKENISLKAELENKKGNKNSEGDNKIIQPHINDVLKQYQKEPEAPSINNYDLLKEEIENIRKDFINSHSDILNYTSLEDKKFEDLKTDISNQHKEINQKISKWEDYLNKFETKNFSSKSNFDTCQKEIRELEKRYNSVFEQLQNEIEEIQEKELKKE